MVKQKGKTKSLKWYLKRFEDSNEVVNKSIANFRCSQVGFTEKMREEILEMLKKDKKPKLW